jgi:hypothetical protein
MVRVQLQAPVTLNPEKSPVTHCTRGWGGPAARLEECRKYKIFFPHSSFEPGTF